MNTTRYPRWMDREPFVTRPATQEPWEAPTFELISLSCEITSYAPDDEPLF